jgi:hypothetical protein
MRKYLSFSLGALLLPLVALAAPVSLSDYNQPCPSYLVCGNDAVKIVALRIITGVSTFIVALAVVAFLYGAILMIISRGDEKKEAGKKAMIYGGIGLTLGIMAKAILFFICTILYTLGGGSGGTVTCSVWM